VAVALMSVQVLGATTRPASGPAGLTEAQRVEVSRLSRRAVDQIELRKFADAEQTLGEALKIMPDNSTCLFNLACVHAAMRRPRIALEDLNHATAAGFTDFSHLDADPVFSEVRELPGYGELVSRKTEIVHAAGERIIGELKAKLGEKYLYEADEKRKFVFAARGTRAQLDELEKSLNEQAASLSELIFSHPSDEFIRIVLATPVDFAKLEKRPGVEGYYDDSTRTLLVRRSGAELRHEFTHALHAADQHALGQAHPIWLSEGLATLYESPQSGTDAIKMLPGETWRLSGVQAAVRGGGLIPLDQLLTMNRKAFTERADLAYGEAGSLLMYFQDQKKLKAFYAAFTANYAKDPSGREALEIASGGSLADLQKAWVQWLMGRVPPAKRDSKSIR
jgi:hypothetical protein